MRYTIRSVDSSHPALLTLQDELFPDCETYKPNGAWWWLAYGDDDIAGFAGLSRTKADKSTGYLCRAGVLPKHRGNGLQRRFINVRLQKARRLGMTAVVTDTTSWNASSVNNLIACGFKMHDPENPWKAKGACYWLKHLTH